MSLRKDCPKSGKYIFQKLPKFNIYTMGKNSRSPVILFVISGAEFCLVIRAFKLRSHEHAKNGSVFLHPSDFFGQCYGKNWTER
jgi:hypothetical protein